jgi:murein DD-endopeptidase MepM/ murein hydrolase activator NlpD
VVSVAIVMLVGAAAFPSQAQTESTTTTTAQTTTTLSAEEKAKKAEAAGNLNAAKAADSEIAAALLSINEAAQTTQSRIDQAQRQLEVARETMATATSELAESNDEQELIEEQLRSKAVEGFKSGFHDPGPLFSERDINQSIRQAVLLQETNKSTADLLEDLRALLEDRQVAQAEASQAAEDAEALEAQLVAELETLREQSTVQLELKAEAESRIAKWEAELTAYAAEDSAIQQLIADSTASPIAVPAPAEPSLLGYQWPVVGRVTSPFGYRIHPVYGTRKLHSGLDVGAPTGTPIAATSGGEVIFSGWRGGYGNAVIIDHGGGITSLYAHMSQLGVSEGTTVDRGDIVGLVGATGTATGPHLHFEIRLGGTPVDPAPYLP